MVSVTPLAGANALSRSCRTGPYKKGVFPGLYRHIVNAHNSQLPEQTNYKPVSFGCLLSNDYAQLFIKHIQNHSPRPCAAYNLNGVGGSDALPTTSSVTASFPVLLLQDLCSRQSCKSVKQQFRALQSLQQEKPF